VPKGKGKKILLKNIFFFDKLKKILLKNIFFFDKLKKILLKNIFFFAKLKKTNFDIFLEEKTLKYLTLQVNNMSIMGY
jgi:hypothetical protein